MKLTELAHEFTHELSRKNRDLSLGNLVPELKLNVALMLYCAILHMRSSSCASDSVHRDGVIVVTSARDCNRAQQKEFCIEKLII